jgi:hypothetical protein
VGALSKFLTPQLLKLGEAIRMLLDRSPTLFVMLK